MREYKHYLLHAFLQNFTETGFFIFGSLLIYSKTRSLLLLLLFGMVKKSTDLLLKSLLVKQFLKFVQATSAIFVMKLSLFLWGVSLISLFLLDVHGGFSLVMLFVIAALYAVSNSSYWILSNAFMFEYVGGSALPGRYSSYLFMTITLSSLLAGLSGLLLNLNDNFVILFVLMGGMLLLSMFPLHYLKPLPVKVVSFKECLKKISPAAFWANVNPEHDLITTAVPLTILFIFGSLSKSATISALATLITIIFVYLVGRNKDSNSNRLVWMGVIALVSTLVLYGFIKTPAQFLILGVIWGISKTVVNTSREARLGREVFNSSEPIQATVVVEFARSFGGFISHSVLILTLAFAGSLWQPILMLGAVFVLPQVLYALKNIDSVGPKPAAG